MCGAWGRAVLRRESTAGTGDSGGPYPSPPAPSRLTARTLTSSGFPPSAWYATGDVLLVFVLRIRSPYVAVMRGCRSPRAFLPSQQPLVAGCYTVVPRWEEARLSKRGVGLK
ncbi:hypothetical protein GCM10009654_50840 [Streptomyces hebeiensis]|uniref:Uncharacterized protein n=1 Tax=Streptomyces hebeiensis TaxID=229486 RepID=A0ABN1V3M7_9ACTN